MKEFTVISLLAQVPQPMLADNCPLSSHMTEGTVSTSCARAIHEELTQSSLVFCMGVYCGHPMCKVTYYLCYGNL